MTAAQARPAQRRSCRGQSVVEFAIMLPVLVIMALGGISINTFIQARSQLSQGVARAALVGARDAQDPCMPGDLGYADVTIAFTQAVTSTAFTPPLLQAPGSLLAGTPAPLITCTSQDGTAHSDTPPEIQAWFNIHNLPTCYKALPPQDSGCFAIWTGGIITVRADIAITLRWVPLFNRATVGDSAGQLLEPFRLHVCPAPFNGTEAC